MSKPSFHSHDFVSRLMATFCQVISSRHIQNPCQFVGAQSASTFTQENVLLCEGFPLWNCADHGDCMRTVRELCATALEVTIEDYDSDLQNAVVVDLIVDALALAVRRSFSSLQVQQLLLLVVRTHADIVGIRFEAEGDERIPVNEDALEGVVARRLTRRMIELTSKVATPCVEKRNIMETIYEERVDPAALAALEAKRDPKANKKQQTAFEDQMRNLPKAVVEIQVPKEIEVEVMVDIGPIFSYDDASIICNHLSESQLMHWRLFRYCKTQPREEDVLYVDVELRDAPPFTIPPLSSALPEADFRALEARRNVWNCADESIARSFHELFLVPVSELHASAQTILRHYVDATERSDVADRDAALPLDEFEKTVDVLRRRVGKKLLTNTVSIADASKSAADASQLLNRHHSLSQPVTPPRATSSTSNSSYVNAAADVGGLTPQEGDSTCTFDFAAVEQRLAALNEAVSKAVSAASPAAKGGKR